MLVPPLRELEGYVFEQLLRQLWRNVLLEATFGDTLAGASAAKPLLPSKHRQATREEQAVQRWLQALQVRSASAGRCAGTLLKGHDWAAISGAPFKAVARIPANDAKLSLTIAGRPPRVG